jgi:hypothetical protein
MTAVNQPTGNYFVVQSYRNTINSYFVPEVLDSSFEGMSSSRGRGKDHRVNKSRPRLAGSLDARDSLNAACIVFFMSADWDAEMATPK